MSKERDSRAAAKPQKTAKKQTKPKGDLSLPFAAPPHADVAGKEKDGGTIKKTRRAKLCGFLKGQTKLTW